MALDFLVDPLVHVSLQHPLKTSWKRELLTTTATSTSTVLIKVEQTSTDKPLHQKSLVAPVGLHFHDHPTKLKH